MGAARDTRGAEERHAPARAVRDPELRCTSADSFAAGRLADTPRPIPLFSPSPIVPPTRASPARSAPPTRAALSARPAAHRAVLPGDGRAARLVVLPLRGRDQGAGRRRAPAQDLRAQADGRGGALEARVLAPRRVRPRREHAHRPPVLLPRGRGSSFPLLLLIAPAVLLSPACAHGPRGAGVFLPLLFW